MRTEIAQLLSRVVIGVTFLQSGWGKLQHLDKVTAFFTELGIPHSGLVAPFTAVNELFFGGLIFLGLAARWAAPPLIVIMIVAIGTAKLDELTDVASLFSLAEFLYIVILVWIIGEGPGKLSLDHLICRRKEQNSAPKPS